MTILYLIDETVDASEKDIETFIGFVNYQAQLYLQNYFHTETTLNNKTKYISNDSNLQKLMESNNNKPYVYVEGTISSLTSYFEKKTQS
uniref:Putative p32 protein n=1 Tax=Ixodes ricinus TaxID=34613 RepID=A0A0K8RDZ4_IXORI